MFPNICNCNIGIPYFILVTQLLIDNANVLTVTWTQTPPLQTLSLRFNLKQSF